MARLKLINALSSPSPVALISLTTFCYESITTTTNGIPFKSCAWTDVDSRFLCL
jgi:hypothetical protein